MTWTQIVKVHSFFMSNILGSLSMVRNALDPLKLINDPVYHSGLLVWNAMKIDYLLLLGRKSAILPIYLHTIRLIVRKRSSVSIDSRNASFFSLQLQSRPRSLESWQQSNHWSLKETKEDQWNHLDSAERTLMKTFWYEKWSASVDDERAFKDIKSGYDIIIMVVLVISRCETLLVGESAGTSNFWHQN